MVDLLAVYICPAHGEVLEDEVGSVEDIDCTNDEVYKIYIHDPVGGCGREVRPKKVGDAICFETVDHERWLWATGFYDEEAHGDEN